MDTPNATTSPTILVAAALLSNTANATTTIATATATATSRSSNSNSDNSSSTSTSQQNTAAANNKYSYSAPASPIASNVTASNASSNVSTATTTIPSTVPTPHQRAAYSAYVPAQHSSAAATASATAAAAANANANTNTNTPHNSALSTPKKSICDAATLEAIRNKLRTPNNGNCELQSLRWEHAVEPVNVIKSRYVISVCEPQPANGAASATPAKTNAAIFRQRIDLLSSNMKCTDIITKQEFLCKIINEPLHKVQRAYFALKQDIEGCQSTIYGHTLIRGVHDIVPLSEKRTYIIIAPMPQPPPSAWSTPVAHEQYNESADNWGVKEDLHTYIRNKRRLCEAEARALFHQICQTVQVCHRNGIILRDLKLKRFYFIDEARTKLQYESLEGSMILDNLNDDTLSDKIGCPLYTAPELLCQNPTYHGKPADMWSLGVILYTMLVGQYPFYERGNYNLITVIRHCHVQIPSSLSRSVRWLLLALLRKNYEERMTSGQIFISPWLKEQRPFYMYIPVDVVVGDFEDEEMATDCEVEYAYDEEMLLSPNVLPKHDSNDSVQNADEQEEEAQDDEDVGVQPLDYTCATLAHSAYRWR